MSKLDEILDGYNTPYAAPAIHTTITPYSYGDIETIYYKTLKAVFKQGYNGVWYRIIYQHNTLYNKIPIDRDRQYTDDIKHLAYRYMVSIYDEQKTLKATKYYRKIEEKPLHTNEEEVYIERVSKEVSGLYSQFNSTENEILRCVLRNKIKGLMNKYHRKFGGVELIL